MANYKLHLNIITVIEYIVISNLTTKSCGCTDVLVMLQIL
jgi:hypothetical protein